MTRWDTESHWREQSDRMSRARRKSVFVPRACDDETGDADWRAWRWGVCGLLTAVAATLAVLYGGDAWAWLSTLGEDLFAQFPKPH